MAKQFDKLGMKDLRELGYDLEAHLDREIKGSSRKSELRDNVLEALRELELETAVSVLEARDIDAASAGFAPASEEPESEYAKPENHVRETPLSELEPETPPESDESAPDSSPEESDEETGADEDEALSVDSAKPALPFAIQIREHPQNRKYDYGDIIKNPSAEICARFVHSPLSEDGVRRLVAKGYRVKTAPK